MDESNHWDDETKLKFICAFREEKVFVDFLCNKKDVGSLLACLNNRFDKVRESLESFSKLFKLPGTQPLCYFLSKILNLRYNFLMIMDKIRKNPHYKPEMKWFSALSKTINNNMHKDGQASIVNAHAGENSNQSSSGGLRETREDPDVDFADLPTQIYIPKPKEYSKEGPAVTTNNSSVQPSTIPSNSLLRNIDETSDDTNDTSNLPTQVYVPKPQEHSRNGPAVPLSTNNSSVIFDATSTLLTREDQSKIPEKPGSSITERDVAEDDMQIDVDIPTGGTDETLTYFGKYLVSLMHQIPLDKCYQLQQKFITETINTKIKFDRERALKKRKRELSNAHSGQRSSKSAGARQERSRVDECSYRGVPNRNRVSERPFGCGQRSGPSVLPNNVTASGENNSLNTMFGVSEITIEEGPQINLIKEELETNFESVYCGDSSSFDMNETKFVSEKLEVFTGEKRKKHHEDAQKGKQRNS